MQPLPAAPVTGPAADYPITIGAPFVIDGVNYAPEDRLNYDAVGFAAIGSEGGTAISLAHKTLPLPSYAEVTSLVSGRTILVRVERRGPLVNEQLVELSPGAAAQLGITGVDKAPVRVRRVNPPEQERALLRLGQRVTERMETPKGLLTALLRKLDPAPAAPPLETAAPPLSPQGAVKIPVSAPQPAPLSPPTPPETGAATKPSLPSVPVLAPEATPAPSQPAKPVSGTPRPASTGRFIVQIATFSTRERAAAAAGKLGAHIGQAGRLFPIQLGPFATRGEADAALARARAGGYRDARIRRTE